MVASRSGQMLIESSIPGAERYEQPTRVLSDLYEGGGREGEKERGRGREGRSKGGGGRGGVGERERERGQCQHCIKPISELV